MYLKKSSAFFCFLVSYPNCGCIQKNLLNHFTHYNCWPTLNVETVGLILEFTISQLVNTFVEKLLNYVFFYLASHSTFCNDFNYLTDDSRSIESLVHLLHNLSQSKNLNRFRRGCFYRCAQKS